MEQLLIGSKYWNTYNLKATVSPSNATNKTVNWSSSNSNIESVDQKGKVTAKAVGTATITAKTSNGKTAKCTVNVLFNKNNPTGGRFIGDILNSKVWTVANVDIYKEVRTKK